MFPLRWLIIVPALIGFLITASPAEADGSDVWLFSKSCLAAEGGGVEQVGDGFRLAGADGGTCAGASHWVRMQATIPEGMNQLGFNWLYQTNDGWYYDPPQYAVNGVLVTLPQGQATGSRVVAVQPGDIFTFQQFSTDSCCSPGYLTITGLTLGLGEWASTTLSTTTTATSSTTVPPSTVPVTNPTTTTVQETTSTSTTLQTVAPTTTTEPPQTSTTIQETTSTVTSTSSTTTTTSTTVAPTTTTTVYVPPVTTTTVHETTTTTTTTEPVPAPTTTLPPPIQTSTSTSTTTTTLPPVTTTEPDVTTTEPDVTTTLQTPTDEPTPLTQTELLNTLKALSEASTEAIQGIVEEVLTKELNTSQATLLIASPAVLDNITPTQAEQLFEQITPTDLSPDEAAAVVEAVQDAPSSIRKAFESVLNIFQGFADSYVPLNSTVPVKTRRALIALSAVFLTVAPAPARRNK